MEKQFFSHILAQNPLLFSSVLVFILIVLAGGFVFYFAVYYPFSFEQPMSHEKQLFSPSTSQPTVQQSGTVILQENNNLSLEEERHGFELTLGLMISSSIRLGPGHYRVLQQQLFDMYTRGLTDETFQFLRLQLELLDPSRPQNPF
ncbi:MAG: hypothetical protein COU08_04375 [Candidatus Harrisonbacteria bacterium CG10_big_fil_rev_8_21_14_0_10_42_17]|uniref:Uncharacterized protein n=1 Tax=Candidatus Harrisonbacteria bacterium CG10_big_fil_rev_8_21_14_0_10_42_17 TaxID=1974584 RepID=A0A2M6WGY9_9BACT|nr:MAG: hypothetical protein COU08_04375 [Candidatus Harrisonbacteria bacterium CG10_big_fil_rev_8_21_14_0_10_42_17]